MKIEHWELNIGQIPGLIQGLVRRRSHAEFVMKVRLLVELDESHE